MQWCDYLTWCSFLLFISRCVIFMQFSGIWRAIILQIDKLTITIWNCPRSSCDKIPLFCESNDDICRQYVHSLTVCSFSYYGFERLQHQQFFLMSCYEWYVCDWTLNFASCWWGRRYKQISCSFLLFGRVTSRCRYSVPSILFKKWCVWAHVCVTDLLYGDLWNFIYIAVFKNCYKNVADFVSFSLILKVKHFHDFYWFMSYNCFTFYKQYEDQAGINQDLKAVCRKLLNCKTF